VITVWQMSITFCLILLGCQVILAQLPMNSYYSSAGTYQSNCQVSSCAPCPAGSYRSGCGNDGSDNKALFGSSGTCTACTVQLPPYASWDSTQLGSLYSDTCNFICNSGYYKSGNTCLSLICPPPSHNRATVTGNQPSCVYTCNAGYRSVSGQTASYTCAECPAGTFSSQGDVSCTPCPTNQYAVSSASASCTICPLPVTWGMYLSGCGGTSAGSLAQCSNA
jgi:hypothetical protein